MINNIPFHRSTINSPINDIFEESINNSWLTTGPKVKEFEDLLSHYLESKHVICLNSCTAALHLGLAAINLKKSDKFIAPSYTFVASIEAGEYLNATPILVDSCPNTFNIDLNQVESILKKDKKSTIKSIIPVHFAGQAVDLKEIYYFADKYGVFILEDAAHSLETVSNVGKVGNTNYATAFSFYANKNITTAGEGGALATNDDVIADKVKKLSLHGMDKDGWKRFRNDGKWGYDVSMLGYKYNMTDISASYGLDQFKKINEWHDKRCFIANFYSQKIGSIEGIKLPKFLMGEKHAWHLFIIQILPEFWKINRNQIIEKLNKLKIGTSVHYIPVHMHSYYKSKYNFKDSDFPNSKILSETVISLPIYPDLKLEELNYIVEMFKILWIDFKK